MQLSHIFLQDDSLGSSVPLNSSNLPQNSKNLPQGMTEEGTEGKKRKGPQERTSKSEAAQRDKLDPGFDLNKTYCLGESMAHLDPNSVSWQSMETLRQLQAESETPPAPPPPKRRSHKMTTKEVRFAPAKQAKITCDGRNAAQGGSKLLPGKEQKEKAKKSERFLPAINKGSRKTGSLGLEGQRASIERGGTNMIQMEVSGIASPPPQQFADHSFEERDVQKLAEFDSPKTARKNPFSKLRFRKNRVAPAAPTFTTEDDVDTSDEYYLPDPPRPRKKRKKKVAGANDETPHRKKDSADEENRSSTEMIRFMGEVIALRPFPNGGVGVRETLQLLRGEDWHGKCDGLVGVHRLIRFHQSELIDDLHRVVIAVLAEVRVYGYLNVTKVNCTFI